MASRLLYERVMKPAAWAALAMLASACQPIVLEPDAGPAVNHPPRIVEGFETPAQTVFDGVTDADCRAIDFSVGSVEDDDIDQAVQERWVLNYDPADPNPDLGVTLTLQQNESQPAYRTDPPNAFVITAQALTTSQFASGSINRVDVFISDGFDNGGAPGKVVRPTDVLPDHYLVRHTWVITMSGSCP